MQSKSGLDCLTPVGKKFIEKQKETGFIIENLLNVNVIHTEDDAEEFDCFLYDWGSSSHDSELMGVGEIKVRLEFSRDRKEICTLKKLKKWGTYLISATKPDTLQKQSLIHKVPSYLFVNLPNDRKLLVFKMTDKNGIFFFKFEKEWRRTRFSSNDYKGDKFELCAMLPIVGNKHFKSFDY